MLGGLVPILGEHSGFERLPAPVAIIRGTEVVYANPELARLIGTPRDRLVGLSVSELMQNFSGERNWVDTLNSSAGGLGPWVSVRTPDDERSYRVQFSEGPIDGERLCLLLDAAGEVAARRLTEALAVGAEAMMRCRTDWEVLDAAVEIIAQQGFFAATLLIEGEVMRHGPLRQNPDGLAIAEKLYGMPIEQVRFPLSGMPHLQQTFATRRGSYADDLASALAKLHSREVLEEIKKAYSGFRNVDAPIFVHDKPFGTIGIMGRTLTPTNAATLELFARQIGAALENVRHHQAAAKQVRELGLLQAQLVARERLAAVGEVSAVLAHEIRSPVWAIIHSVSILKQGTGGSEHGVLPMIESEALRLEHLVRALLDYTGPLEPRRCAVDLAEVARRTAQLLASRNALGQVKVEVVEEGSPVQVLADPELLELALVNLTLNAIQASPPGATVRLSTVHEAQGGRILVDDAGTGVAPEHLTRIFEPFFTTRARGTGLGLAVVSRVTRAHKGEVVVSRSPLGGARFEIRVPAS